MMKKEDNKDFKNSNKYRNCDNTYVVGSMSYHCHTTGKQRGSAQRDCNSNVIL